MKIAIVCDWLVTYAGSERVLGEFLNCFPEAEIFAVVDFIPEKDRHFLLNKPVTTSFIQKLPLAKRFYRHYLPLMPLAIEQLDLSGFDLILSNSHAVAKGVITGPDQLHLCYTHSPMRYAWDLQHQYLQDSGLQKNLKGWLVKWFLHRLRIWDARTANGVDHFATSSKYIARRIYKTYRREALVIFPPVDTDFFTPHHQKEDFYLAASRLVPYKKIDMIVEAFQTMPHKKLVVIGDGPDFKKIKAKAGPNVQILGYQSADTLKYYLQRAKAFIFASEEDFGILPLEAQASGTPVIAFGKGGSLETVRPITLEHPTGLFFKEQNPSSLIEAIQQFETNPSLFTVEACVNHAKKFHPECFRQQYKNFVESKLKERELA